MTLTGEMVLPEDMAAMRSSPTPLLGATLPTVTSSASMSSSRIEEVPLTAGEVARRAEVVASIGLRSVEVELGGAEVPESMSDTAEVR
ncbi:hypothetical protein Dimus_036769 [Dionaea muscipula]